MSESKKPPPERSIEDGVPYQVDRMIEDQLQDQQAERSRQVGVSFPVDRMIAEQLKAEQAEAEAAKKRTAERTRPEVYGMPVDEIIHQAVKHYPGEESAAGGQKPAPEPVPSTWSLRSENEAATLE